MDLQVHCDLKGELPLALLVTSAGEDGEVVDAAKLAVRERVGAFASLGAAAVVGALPKTRSGKILRSSMRAIADARPYKLPGTIEDASVIDDHIVPALRALGYAGES